MYKIDRARGKALIERISPAGLLPRIQLHAPKCSNGLSRCLYRAKATFGYANGMVGTSPRIRTVSARSNHELVEAR